jgi:hypothetical protein
VLSSQFLILQFCAFIGTPFSVDFCEIVKPVEKATKWTRIGTCPAQAEHKSIGLAKVFTQN